MHFLPLPFRMLLDKGVQLSSKFFSKHARWNPEQTLSYLRQIGVFEEYKIVKSAPYPFARVIAKVRRDGKRGILKMHKAHQQSSHLVQVANELEVIRIAGKHTTVKSAVIFPKIYATHTASTEVYGIREYLMGKQLLKYPAKMREAYAACLSAFTDISKRLSAREAALLPKREPISMLLTFPVLSLMAIGKNRSYIGDIFSLIVLFLRHISFSDLFFPRYILAHRDLSPENILIMHDKFGVIDAEVAALCEQGTDLALFPRFYHRFIPLQDILTFLKTQIRTPKERSAFIRLTIYYTLHYLAICDTSDAYYQEARDYLKVFSMELYPRLTVAGGSAYEKALQFLLLLPLRLGFPLSRFLPTKDFIICYHSIASESERYTTAPEQFERQLTYLSKHTAIMPVTTLLAGYPKSAKPRTTITFDDGYQDTFTTAFPLLRAHDLTATVFVIGNRMKLNQQRQTYLNKSLMTIAEVKTLRKNGWEIGFHTETHQALTSLAKEQREKEMTGSKMSIEKYIGAPLRYIAYPFGRYNDAVLRHLPVAGYEAGFTTDAGPYHKSAIAALPRIDIEGALTETTFIMLCSSYGLTVSRLLMRLLTGKIYIEQWLKSLPKKHS